MRRGILIALVAVPALALAGPRKRPKKKAAPPPAEKTEKPAEPPAETTPAPAAGAGSAAPTVSPTVPTVPTGMSPTTKGTGPLSSGTQPTTPTGVPAATTPPPAAAPEKEEPAANDVDVDSLRQEYLSLRDELYKSRARANAVASALYSTRITIKFTWGSARYYGVSKASIRLDGATVYEDASGAIATDDGVRFDGYIAPGRHLITFHVDATGKDDDSFTSSTEAQIVVKAVAQKDLVVSAKGKDSGDIAYEWKKSEHGSYGLGIDVGVKTVASAKAAKK
ncbi:MAG: hypothetical protein HOV81_22000 [Kofleriaceae bacterium]|nr:hypothetical protein [Kofleriaceae bacterium]